MHISVNLRQQIAKMCCKSNAMWKCCTSSIGQQQLQQQQQPMTTTTRNTEYHGQAKRHRINNKSQKDFLGRIRILVFIVMLVLIQMQSVTAGLREGLSGESKCLRYLLIMYRNDEENSALSRSTRWAKYLSCLGWYIYVYIYM